MSNRKQLRTVGCIVALLVGCGGPGAASINPSMADCRPLDRAEAAQPNTAVPPAGTQAPPTPNEVTSAPAPSAGAKGHRARWMMNDRSLTANETRVFDRLPTALRPTPEGYTNLISWFQVREDNPHSWLFSGVRLISAMDYVYTRPEAEWFFHGSFDPSDGTILVYRELRLSDGP